MVILAVMTKAGIILYPLSLCSTSHSKYPAIIECIHVENKICEIININNSFLYVNKIFVINCYGELHQLYMLIFAKR